MPRDIQRKIVTKQRLLHLVERARERNQSIVQCHGCFDIVHPGHIRYLEFAAQQGDVLIVSLTGDSNVAKGAQRPYIPERLRAESLAALECVDLVIIDPNPTAESILKEVRPDVYVKGREYEGSADPRFLRERRAVEDQGGRVIFSSGEVVYSSTKLIDSLARDSDVETENLRVLCDRRRITRASLHETIERFRRLRVLVVGDVVVDRYVFCDAIDVASEAPMMALKTLDEQSYVGGAAIVARHAAALGARAFLLTAGANDGNSKRVEDVLESEGVESHVLRCRPNIVEKTRYLVDDNKLFKVETGERVPLDSLAERLAIKILDEQTEFDVAIFCDFGYGMITEGFMRRVIGRLRERVRIIAADVSGTRASLLNFRHADLLCPTERELRSNLHDYERGLSSVAYDLLQQTQAKHLFVTLEKRGLVVFDRPANNPDEPEWSNRLLSEHVPSFADRPVDRLGGGDALLATSALSLGAGANLAQAAYLGSGAAAMELGILGNAPIHALTLRRWVENRTELATSPDAGAVGAPSLASVG